MIDGIRVVANSDKLNCYKMIDCGMNIKNLAFNKYCLRGSIHKFKNNGEHNVDDFTFSDYKRTHLKFVSKYGLDIDTLRLTSFEFGLNVELPYPVDWFLNSVVKHNSKFPYRSSNYLEFKYGQYVLKLYDKSQIRPKDKDFGKNILRVEIKVKQKDFLTNKGLTGINDLIALDDVLVWNTLYKILVKTFDRLTIIGVDFVSNKPSLKRTVYQYQNPNTWNQVKNRNLRYKMNEKVKALMQKHPEIDYRKHVLQLFEIKYNSLISN